MRKIKKSSEPKEWTEYRLTSGAVYQRKPQLAESLLQEQGYLCAYCMRRIPVSDKNSSEDTRIDHILSQDNNPDRTLDYSNMAICCPGAINSSFHCDKSKGSANITFDLYHDAFFETLSYKSQDGAICSSNAVYNDEINRLLNLNNPLLKANRLSAWNGVKKYLVKGHWSLAKINEQLKNWESKDHEGKYKEYCGIVLFYLQKKKRMLSKEPKKHLHA